MSTLDWIITIEGLTLIGIVTSEILDWKSKKLSRELEEIKRKRENLDARQRLRNTVADIKRKRRKMHPRIVNISEYEDHLKSMERPADEN